MSSRKKAEAAADKVRNEIQDIKTQIENLMNDVAMKEMKLAGMEEMLSLYPKEEPSVRRSTSSSQLRPGSDMDRARIAIAAAGEPMRIEKIMLALGKSENDRKARISISSSIQAYVRNEKIFTKPAPNTFGLIDMPEAQERSVSDLLGDAT